METLTFEIVQIKNCLLYWLEIITIYNNKIKMDVVPLFRINYNSFQIVNRQDERYHR